MTAARPGDLGASDQDSGAVPDARDAPDAQTTRTQWATPPERAESVAHVGSWRLDYASGRVTWSDELYRIFGLERGTDPNLPVEFIRGSTHPDDREVVDAAIEAAEAGVDPGAIEYRVVRPDGQTRWVRGQGAVDRDAAGQPITMVGFIQDITELRATQLALQDTWTRSEAARVALAESERTLRRTILGLDAIVVHQPAAEGPLYVSPQIIGILGRTPEEVATVEAWNDLVHPDDLPRCRAAWADRARTWHFEYRMRHADGTWRWVSDHGRGEPAGTADPAEALGAADEPGEPVDGPAARDRRGEGAFGMVTDVTAQHEAAERLRESEERFRAVFEESPEIMGIIAPVFDAAGRMTDAVVLDMNRTTRERQMDGLPRDAVVGQRMFDRWPHLREPVFAAMASVAETGVPFRGELSSARFGITHWSDFSIFPFDGGLALVGRDVTARRVAEIALQASEARYRAVADSAADAIVTAGEDARIVGWNRAAERMFGVPAAQAIGMPLAALMPARFVEDHGGAFGRFVADPERHPSGAPAAMTGARADGAEFPVELTLSDWTLDDRRYVTAIIRDVTEREAAERAVREAQAGLARLGTAIDQASDSVLITDTDARILYVNPAFERTSGYRRDEVVGQNPRLLASGEHPPAFYQDLWDTLTAGRTWHGEIVNKRKDGTRFIIDATIGPVRDAAGAVTAYVAVKRDVTAERDLEARLRQAQRMEAVGQLAGGVAHDFNNLLAAISGYAEFVRAALPDAAESRHDINEVLRATERAAELTRQLLAFSRRQALAPVVLDPAEVIGGVVPMLRRLLGEHIALVTANEIGDVRVVADRGQLEQVIVNLAVNARDAMPEGGRLSITAGTAVLTPDDVADTPDLSPGPVARITVADTGTGIDAAVLPRIFDPFFTTKAAGKGTGLGLATVYGIVRASGGRITVASTPGAGSRFCIDLPVSSVVPSTGETAATPVGPPPLRATVLLVEDERAVRVVLARHLAGAGCVVHQAASGEQALLLWPALPQIDLVVSDVRMPGIQGPDLVRRLRALRPGLPALLISGYAEGLTLDAPGLDGVRLLDKPFEAARLVEIVRAMVDGDAGPSAD